MRPAGCVVRHTHVYVCTPTHVSNRAVASYSQVRSGREERMDYFILQQGQYRYEVTHWLEIRQSGRLVASLQSISVQ